MQSVFYFLKQAGTLNRKRGERPASGRMRTGLPDCVFSCRHTKTCTKSVDILFATLYSIAYIYAAFPVILKMLKKRTFQKGQEKTYA